MLVITRLVQVIQLGRPHKADDDQLELINFHPVCLLRTRTGIAHSQVRRSRGFDLTFLRDRMGACLVAATAGFGACSDEAIAGARTRGHSTGQGPARMDKDMMVSL
jgi:hypothetical protein